MSKKHKAVIGLNYGDEGKGLTTDWLSSLNPKTPVVRFNGGAQAAHTVQLNDGRRNVFHHIGSGYFNNSPTYMTKDFLISPQLFIYELSDISEGYNYKHPISKFTSFDFYCDSNCEVVTPYDVAYNQELENKRKENGSHHGSCGVGIGATMSRVEDGLVSFRASDLATIEKTKSKIIEVEKYYSGKFECIDKIKDKYANVFKDFEYACDVFSDIVTILDVSLKIKDSSGVIFEGAQGLFLDQNSIDFPHVTRSNTGLKNIIPFLDDNCELEIFYITRSYLTRHGAGPLKEEIFNFPIDDKTNIDNKFQEHLRLAPLDYERMFHEINKDLKNLEGVNFKNYKVNFVVTHCDNLYTEINVENIIQQMFWVYPNLNKVYYSDGPTRSHVKLHSRNHISA